MSSITLQEESLFSMVQKDSLSIGNRRGQRCRKCFHGVFVVLVAGEFLNVNELLPATPCPVCLAARISYCHKVWKILVCRCFVLSWKQAIFSAHIPLFTVISRKWYIYGSVLKKNKPPPITTYCELVSLVWLTKPIKSVLFCQCWPDVLLRCMKK